MVPNDLSDSKLFSALDGSSLVYLDGRLHETALVVAKEVIITLSLPNDGLLKACEEYINYEEINFF